MDRAIYFDLDGTLANLYSVDNWLDKLRAFDASPYMDAVPMVNMSLLARYLNRLHAIGYHIGIVSWTSKVSTNDYHEAVSNAKRKWLHKHLKSVQFDEINIIPYGTPKQEVVDMVGGILFDDEERNRTTWLGQAYDVDNIIGVLKSLLVE